jgi:hypothetical protein
MKQSDDFDPLESAFDILTFIISEKRSKDDVEKLAALIDTFMYSLRFLRIDQVNLIGETDEEPPELNDNELRKNIGLRFPDLGLYWTALRSKITVDQDGEIAVSDAIDDLLDITREFKRVKWVLENHGRTEALCVLRFCYECHLYMHFPLLRAHLEELTYV